MSKPLLGTIWMCLCSSQQSKDDHIPHPTKYLLHYEFLTVIEYMYSGSSSTNYFSLFDPLALCPTSLHSTLAPDARFEKRKDKK